MGIMIDEAITRYKNNAEYERTHGNLQGCLEFRQLAEWLEKYQKIEEIVKQKDYDRFNSHNYYGYFLRVQDIRKVIEDEKTNWEVKAVARGCW